MASEMDLIRVLQNRAKVWTPTELCNALDVHVIELVRLMDKARKQGVEVCVVNGERTGNSGKIFLGGEHV
ncbi:hypothetical protein [Vibrio algicola]|uniref:Uncharacterized protein n=1 Tax=Vibrio algicola TaxID=2662262 RepID=A0A5Q0TNI4_9VIBR|nr:hypothetical protein [Vibrio algicola]